MEENQVLINKIKNLVNILNEASLAYYNGEEIMSNAEWDAGFDELTKLEAETGYVLSNSPTQTVGAEENIETGSKEAHEFPALSLAKSKDIEVLKKWAGNRPIWLSWKCDGNTLCATFDNGKLSKLITRGNGTIGTNITYLAKYIKGIPLTIDYKGHMVVRGEAMISYPDFERINAELEENEVYSNPRNLASGTLGLDETRGKEVEERGLFFKAFTLVYIDEPIKSWGARMDLLTNMGFNVVERQATDAEHLQEAIEFFTEVVKSGGIDFPVDGLVIVYDDTDYATTGSVTGHHATNAGIAFKWPDKPAETTLDHIEWSCAAHCITPVAVFDMVELEGTEVRRASLCNISELKRLGIGANRQTTMSIIKANMIIPKCIKADSHGTTFEIPESCPVCGAKTAIKTTFNSSTKKETEVLICTNEDCSAKHIKNFTRFVSRDGMNIDGLSEKTLVKFVNEKYITDFTSLYYLDRFKDSIIEMEGFGERSFERISNEIEKSRNVNPVNFIYALSIPMIGLDAAKKIIRNCGTSGFLNKLEFNAGFEDVDGIGKERSNSIIEWYARNKDMFMSLMNEMSLEIVEPQLDVKGSCSGLTFVITGDVNYFKNRNEFKTFVETNGGKVAGSVSKKTDYLVNNDMESNSSKNKKAKDLGVSIISEMEFVEKFINKQ